jgi:hypothetical protein
VIRVAYVLGLIALAMLVPLVTDLSGRTAILFVFVGFPALALAIAILFVERWRAGAFRLDQAARPGTDQERVG